MVFLLIKVLSEILYQWNTVTLSFIARSIFSSFVVPDPGMGVRGKIGTATFFSPEKMVAVPFFPRKW